MTALPLEVTRLVKDHGPLTKRVHLAQDGTIANDSTNCRMSRGIMHRTSLPDWRDFAAVIEETPNNVAYALGTMRADLPASIHLVAKVEPQSEKPGFATRTRGTIQYRDEPGLVLLDFDTKGVPEDVRARLRSLGGFCAAIEAVCAGIALAGYIRRSQRAQAYFIVRRARRILPAASTFMFLSRTSRTDGAEPLAAKHQAIPRVKPDFAIVPARERSLRGLARRGLIHRTEDQANPAGQAGNTAPTKGKRQCLQPHP
jgi:hypothetical protein